MKKAALLILLLVFCPNVHGAMAGGEPEEIVLVSEVDHGSTFTVTLPIDQDNSGQIFEQS